MKHILLITLGIFGLSFAQAQSIDRQVIAVGGGFTTTPTAQVSYTVGETAIQYLSVSGASLSQGFQQAGTTTTAIGKVRRVDAQLNIYPNPFVQYIEVKSDKILNGVAFRLIDASGKQIPIAGKEMQAGKHWRIQLDHIATGNYWLTITAGANQSTYPLTHTAP